MSDTAKMEIKPRTLRALACDVEDCHSPQSWADYCRAAAAMLETQAARIAELEAALLNLIEHTLDCELELDKLHGLGNGAGAGMSSILCEAHAALEGRRDDPAA